MQHVPRVAVVGTGTTGVMALWRLAVRGIPAEGFDRFAPGHDRGAAGGQTRIFRTAYREGQAYVPLLRRAGQLWRELESTTGRTLLTLSGGLTIGAVEDPDVRAVLDCAQAQQIAHEVFEGPRRLGPHVLHDNEIAVRDTEAGLLRAESGIHAAATAAEALGAKIHRYTPVEEIAPYGNGVRIHVDGQQQQFDHVILAPGPWASGMAELAGLPLHGRQISILWFLEHEPNTFVPSTTPIVIRTGDNGFSCVPALDHPGAKIIPRGGRPNVDGPESLPRSAPVWLVEQVRETVSEYLPELAPDPVRIGTYADAYTPDGHGLLGRLPGQDSVSVLAGFSGHGFKLSPALGEIAADLVLDGASSHDISHLSPARFS